VKRPDLSLRAIAGTLALLGTPAVIAACAKSEKAAPSAEVRSEPQGAAASAIAAPPVAAPTVTATAGTEATTAASATAVDEATKGKQGAAPTPSAAASASASAPPGSGGGGMKRGMTGQASCGAGTCATDPKKKK